MVSPTYRTKQLLKFLTPNTRRRVARYKQVTYPYQAYLVLFVTIYFEIGSSRQSKVSTDMQKKQILPLYQQNKIICYNNRHRVANSV